MYGRVSADRFDGKRLPFVGNLVNLLVANDLGGVTLAEVRRVLAPDGVAYVQKGGTWTKIVKPRPAAIDEWSHFLHDASGNAVANDRTIGPPKRLQWVAGPKWCRSHDLCKQHARYCGGKPALSRSCEQESPERPRSGTRSCHS